MLKKIMLAVFGLSMSCTVAAGMMGPCMSNPVTVPCEEKAWALGVDALYWRPLYSASRAYGTSAASEAQVTAINPGWDWGYRLDGSYFFHQGNDLSLRWSHVNQHNTVSGLQNTFLLLADGGGFLITAPNNELLENKFDQVNLVFGQYVKLNPATSTHFYSGLQYARIRTDSTLNYTLTPLITSFTDGVKTFNNTDFNGVGPIVGMDLAYSLFNSGFNIKADSSAFLLYGSGRLNVSDIYGVGLVASNIYGSRKTMVPGFDIKVGANYVYETSLGLLKVDAGFEVMNYFDALQSLSYNIFHSPHIGSSDFGLQGPYFGAKWVGRA